MKKRLLVLFTIFLVVLISGCGKGSNKLEGVWNLYKYNLENKDVYYMFNKDNTGSYTYYDTVQSFTYEVKSDKVVITFKGNTFSSEFKYSIDKNILTIEDSFGSATTYKKK